MTKFFDMTLLLSGVLTGSKVTQHATYGKPESCKRPFNSDGNETIPGPGSSNMCAGFSLAPERPLRQHPILLSAHRSIGLEAIRE